MKKTVYRSRIDWWVWLVTIGFLAIIWLSAIGMSWWYVIFVSGLTTLLYAWLMFGCWYEIDGDELTIYQFFTSHSLANIQNQGHQEDYRLSRDSRNVASASFD